MTASADDSALVPMIPGLSGIAGDYRALLCDVWGVVHNGIAAFPAACDALQRYRRVHGGPVVFITNSPRPVEATRQQLRRLGVPDDAYDGIVTAGDVTRTLIMERGVKKITHIGPERDLPLYEGLGLTLVPADQAEVAVCTGLYDDEVDKPEDYRAELTALAARGLTMICANADRIVERGHKKIFCAGAVAEFYETLGGTAIWLGKPLPEIYRATFAKLAELGGRPFAPKDVLGIGDGLHTDIAGASAQGLDVLFITAGIHASEFGAPETPDPVRVTEILDAHGISARAAMPFLAW